MAGSEEELKSLLMMVEEESERAGLKLNMKKKLRSWNMAPLLHGIWPHYFMANRRDGSSDRFPLLGLYNYYGW